MDSKQRSLPRLAAAGAVVLGLAAGSYGIASAASGSGTATTPSTAPPRPRPRPRLRAGGPVGRAAERRDAAHRRHHEKVTAAAQAEVPGGTIVRVETDADGHAAYEAHMTKADGTPSRST